jgi:hypothetical protein
MNCAVTGPFPLVIEEKVLFSNFLFSVWGPRWPWALTESTLGHVYCILEVETEFPPIPWSALEMQFSMLGMDGWTLAQSIPRMVNAKKQVESLESFPTGLGF